MDMHVVVLGAGSTGLLIAQGLKKYGIKFSVYEREDEYKYTHHQRDWSMALLWGSEYLKKTLPEHLLERFDCIKSDPHDKPGPDRLGTLPLYNGKTAELVAKIPGGVAVRVNREKLRKFLSDDIDISFGKICTSIEEAGDKVTVTFADGSSVTADTVVCADGIKGLGRTILLGAEKAALSVAPCSFVNICNKYTAEQARFIRDSLDPIYKFGGHPDQPTLFMVVPVDIPDLDKPEEWRYQACLSTWGATHSDSNEERLRVFKEAASKYAEPWRSAALWLPDDTYIPPDTIKYWAEPTIWPNWNGKITLAGDGAHPIVPFRAQGLNNALADAHNYVQALVAVRDGTQSLSDAITAYGNEVLERGSAENKLSNMWGPVLHNWNALMNTPMMKQGYGNSKKPETNSEAKEESTNAEPTHKTGTAAENVSNSPAESIKEGPAAANPAELASTTSLPEPEEPVVSREDQISTPAADSPPEIISTSGTLPSETPNLQPPPSTIIVHGQLTPTDEHQSHKFDTMTNDQPLTPTSETGLDLSKADEMARLREEIDALRRRNDLLLEKLRAIQRMVGEVDI